MQHLTLHLNGRKGGAGFHARVPNFVQRFRYHGENLESRIIAIIGILLDLVWGSMTPACLLPEVLHMVSCHVFSLFSK